MSAMLTKEEVYDKLKELGVPFEVTEHNAVFTIDDMKLIEGMNIDDVCKNLFLRDGKGKRHFLVVLREDKSANLKSLEAQLGASHLSFASADRLMKYLGLTKGAVTPLGVLNDANHDVEVLFDRDLQGRKRLGVHPCDNTATVWVSFDELKKVVEGCGNKFRFINL